MSEQIRRAPGVYVGAVVKASNGYGYSATIRWGRDAAGNEIVGRARGVYAPDLSNGGAVIAAAWKARDAVARKLFTDTDAPERVAEFTDRDAYAAVVSDIRPGEYVVTFVPLHGDDVIRTEVRDR